MKAKNVKQHVKDEDYIQLTDKWGTYIYMFKDKIYKTKEEVKKAVHEFKTKTLENHLKKGNH